MTKLQRQQLIRSARAYPEYIRAESAGDRVTLASLYYRGFMERQVWNGGKTTSSAAHEYRLAPEVAETFIATVKAHDEARS